MWRYVKVKGRWQSKEIMTRQSIGKERMVSYIEMIMELLFIENTQIKLIKWNEKRNVDFFF